MAAIPGVVVVGGIIGPTDSLDQYPCGDPQYQIDGYRSVLDVAEMNAISALRRKQGMLVCTQVDMAVYQLDADLVTWLPFSAGASGDKEARWGGFV